MERLPMHKSKQYVDRYNGNKGVLEFCDCNIFFFPIGLLMEMPSQVDMLNC
jgi:hypothetical protein